MKVHLPPRERVRKQFEQGLANGRERSARIQLKAERIKSKLRAAALKKTHSELRRSEFADRDIFEEIQRAIKAGDSVRLSAKSEPPVIMRRYPIYEETWRKIEEQDRQRRQTGWREKKLVVPSWAETGDLLKALSWSVVTANEGGLALTLRLSPDLLERTPPSALAITMRDRIQRTLRAEFRKLSLPTPDFFFSVETSPEPHLHGGIIIPSTRIAREAATRALKSAGGSSFIGRDTGHQLRLQRFHHSVGWAGYLAKWSLVARQALHGGRVFVATNGLRSRAKAWYEKLRRTEEPIWAAPIPTISDLLLTEEEGDVSALTSAL